MPVLIRADCYMRQPGSICGYRKRTIFAEIAGGIIKADRLLTGTPKAQALCLKPENS